MQLRAGNPGIRLAFLPFFWGNCGRWEDLIWLLRESSSSDLRYSIDPGLPHGEAVCSVENSRASVPGPPSFSPVAKPQTGFCMNLQLYCIYAFVLEVSTEDIESIP